MPMPKSEIPVTFKFAGDMLSQAWYFNRFRVDVIAESVLVTTALTSELGGTPVVNGFVVSLADVEMNKHRSLDYLGALAADVGDQVQDTKLQFSAPPVRVYPVNLMNLSRMNDVGEIALYRYSMHSLLTTTREADKSSSKKSGAAEVQCYPVVLFRSSTFVQLDLIKELFDAVG